MAEFKKGQFVRLVSDNKSFYIYEGKEMSAYPGSYYTRYSVIAHYDPRKYVKVDDKWETIPSLMVSKSETPIDRSIDSNFDGTTYTVLSEEEKQEALRILDDWGYKWDEETLTLSRKDGTVVAQIHTPKIEYCGEQVKPMDNDRKQLLCDVCKAINRKNAAYRSSSSYPSYGGEGRYPYGNDDYPRDYDMWD